MTQTQTQTAPTIDKEALRRDLDALYRETLDRLGDEDVAHLRSVLALSRRLEWIGRGLIFASVEPIGFACGVFSLWLHKQLETIEIGHNVLHGTYDTLTARPELHSTRFRWRLPVHRASWRRAHNGLHHTYTNIVGKDPDARFGTSRLNAQVPHRLRHHVQLLEVGYNWLNLLFNLNLQVTGLVDFYMREAGDDDVLPDRRWRTIARAHLHAIEGATPYLFREYVAWPALAGPLFPKIWLGNALSSVLRNVFSGAAIYCSHIGEELADHPSDHAVRGRAEWMWLQLTTTRNFDVPPWMSLLVGGLDRQIEHHLFPRLPPNRLREIAPRVRAICEAHGAPYRSERWAATIASVLRRAWQLSAP